MTDPRRGDITRILHEVTGLSREEALERLMPETRAASATCERRLREQGVTGM